ncbi:4151_t:CDS:2 [Ambispora leptoticha]|uniref:4151_t:CDS:1 n=1 Tax=Ambispora leptoticha TaxID=144679 RepID=A0A9N9FWZ2_9GLOM|nr:4151_t:CDS:2 [Ambispora leptoticha]
MSMESLKVLVNPARGQIDQTSGKDNNALFYGAPGTGKTSITKRLCLRTNRFPVIEIKVDNFGFTRSSDGEVRYILFVDEANQISENSLKHSPSYLRFLKECMEGVNKEKQSQNLWIFATNYLDEVDKAVYRPGRLKNPRDDKLEDVMKEVKDTVDIRIDELNDLLQQVGTAINNMCTSLQTVTKDILFFGGLLGAPFTGGLSLLGCAPKLFGGGGNQQTQQAPAEAFNLLNKSIEELANMRKDLEAARSNYKPGVDTSKEVLCINCGNSVKKAKNFEKQQKENQTQRQLVNDYSNEFKKLKHELNNKVKTTDLGISDL